MGRRGPAPQYAKREALERLLNDGLSLSEAARRVGVNRKTAKRWRNGRVIRYPGGRAVHYPPVINAPTVKTYSTRYLGEGERVRLADLRREGRTIRSIATLMGRAPSTISRELSRGADSLGRYRPHEAHQRALARRRLDRPSRLARDRQLREWVESKLKRRWSPEQVSRGLRQQFPHQPPDEYKGYLKKYLTAILKKYITTHASSNIDRYDFLSTYTSRSNYDDLMLQLNCKGFKPLLPGKSSVINHDWITRRSFYDILKKLKIRRSILNNIMMDAT
jgi:hypothetical protein